jgi:hypothetical protein
MSLVTVLGLNPVSPRVQEFHSWLVSSDGLGSPGELAMMAVDLNLAPENVLKMVDEKIAVARILIKNMAESRDLRPQVVEVHACAR